MAKTFEQIVAEEEAAFGKTKQRPVPEPEINVFPEIKSRIAGRGTLTEELAGISQDVAPFSSKVQNRFAKEFLRQQEIPFEVMRKGVLSTLTAIKAAESGVTSALLAGMGGEPEKMAEEFIKGVTGQKQTKISDLIRATGIGGEKLNEPVAAIGGFMTEVALTNLATAGTISKGANAVRQSLKRSSVKGARKKGFFFKDQADRFLKGFDDVFTNIRGEFNKLYNKIGNKVIGGDDAIALQDAVTSLPKDVANKISKIKGVNFLDKFQRVLQPNINNAKIIKDQISRTIPKNVWNGIDDGGTNAELYRQMKDSYFKLNEVIANNAGRLKSKLLKLNERNTNLHRFSEKLQPLLRKKSGTTKTTIRKIKSKDMQGDLDEFIKFSDEFFEDGNVILKEIDKMNKSIAFQQGVKNTLNKLGPAAVAGAVGAGVLGTLIRRPISEFVGGGAPTGGGGGG